MLKKGTKVTWAKTTIVGEVARARVDDDGESLQYLVHYEEDGEQHQRWFSAEDVKEVK